MLLVGEFLSQELLDLVTKLLLFELILAELNGLMGLDSLLMNWLVMHGSCLLVVLHRMCLLLDSFHLIEQRSELATHLFFDIFCFLFGMQFTDTFMVHGSSLLVVHFSKFEGCLLLLFSSFEDRLLVRFSS